MDKTIRLRNGSNRGAFVAKKKKQTGGSCSFAQNLRELGKLTNPSLQEMCELFGMQTLAKVCGHNNKKKKKMKHRHPRSRNRTNFA